MTLVLEKQERVLARLCRCGAVVETTLLQDFRRNYLESILCPACGTDNRWRPPLSWRWRHGWRKFRRGQRIRGWWWFVSHRFWRYWQLPYKEGY